MVLLVFLVMLLLVVLLVFLVNGDVVVSGGVGILFDVVMVTLLLV